MVRRKDIEEEINGYLKALCDLGFPYEKPFYLEALQREIRMNTAI